MTNDEIIQHIRDLCTERKWSYYQLAKSAGLSYSTLSTLLNGSSFPSLSTLGKLCSGFGISISEFFSPGHDTAFLSDEQKNCLDLFNALPASKKAIALAYLEGLQGKLQ